MSKVRRIVIRAFGPPSRDIFIEDAHRHRQFKVYNRHDLNTVSFFGRSEARRLRDWLTRFLDEQDG